MAPSTQKAEASVLITLIGCSQSGSAPAFAGTDTAGTTPASAGIGSTTPAAAQPPAAAAPVPAPSPAGGLSRPAPPGGALGQPTGHLAAQWSKAFSAPYASVPTSFLFSDLMPSLSFEQQAGCRALSGALATHAHECAWSFGGLPGVSWQPPGVKGLRCLNAGKAVRSSAAQAVWHAQEPHGSTLELFRTCATAMLPNKEVPAAALPAHKSLPHCQKRMPMCLHFGAAGVTFAEAGSTLCGRGACPPGSRCFDGWNCCPDGVDVCGGVCCDKGRVCLQNQCTAAGSIPCGSAVCTPGQLCTNNVCCPQDQVRTPWACLQVASSHAAHHERQCDMQPLPALRCRGSVARSVTALGKPCLTCCMT